MPFLVDSLGMVCTQSGLAVHLLAHPVLSVVRDRRGRLEARLPGRPADRQPKLESWQLIEIDREPDPGRLAADRGQDPRARSTTCARPPATGAECASRRSDARGRTRRRPHPRPTAARSARRRRCSNGWRTTTSPSSATASTACGAARAEDRLVPVPRSGLGIMRSTRRAQAEDHRARRRRARLRALAGAAHHHQGELGRDRPPLDLPRLRRREDLRPVGHASRGERRFLGLWTSSAYSRSPLEIPLLRHKVAAGHRPLPA